MNDITEQDIEIYTVSQFNEEVRFLLEDTFPQIWIEGEISNFAAPQSGHWYFSLKDTSAQIKCAMFRGSQRKLNFTPKDGMHVLIRAHASLYANRGDFQLIADMMEERGEGKLRREFELLKKKLEAEGLFNPDHKKPLPLYPNKIGVITSATGAAIRDILNVLKRRFPCAPVVIYPSLVQGKTAAATIVDALQKANERNECDVIILARGGGSLEDLWPFNEEIVARAIYHSHIPIVSGIGHEVDFTIADYAADLRAPTPSAAAELITPNQNELLILLKRQAQQTERLILQKISANQQQINWANKHLLQQHPKRRLTEQMQRLDMLELTLTQHQQQYLSTLQFKLQQLNNLHAQQSPDKNITAIQNKIALIKQKINNMMAVKLETYQSRLGSTAAKLNGLSPLATLQRGYAIVMNDKQQVIRSPQDTSKGDQLDITLSEGKLKCVVL